MNTVLLIMIIRLPGSILSALYANTLFCSDLHVQFITFTTCHLLSNEGIKKNKIDFIQMDFCFHVWHFQNVVFYYIKKKLPEWVSGRACVKCKVTEVDS